MINKPQQPNPDLGTLLDEHRDAAMRLVQQEAGIVLLRFESVEDTEISKSRGKRRQKLASAAQVHQEKLRSQWAPQCSLAAWARLVESIEVEKSVVIALSVELLEIEKNTSSDGAVL